MAEFRTVEIVTQDQEQTRDVGRQIARSLGPGSYLGVSGPLGAGKTVLVRGLCEGLGVPPETVSSPTFAIVNTYSGRLPVYHVDLYRVSSFEEVEETGLIDACEPGIVLVEWADRVPELLPEGAVRVHIDDLGGESRRLRITSTLKAIDLRPRRSDGIQ